MTENSDPKPMKNSPVVSLTGSLPSISHHKASIDDLCIWLRRLSRLVNIPLHQSREIDSVIELYAEKLTAFPPDVVRQALAGWPEISEHWPTWKELSEALEAGGARKLTNRDLDLCRRDGVGYYTDDRVAALKARGMWHDGGLAAWVVKQIDR